MNNFWSWSEFFQYMGVLGLPVCFYVMWRLGRIDGMEKMNALIQPREASSEPPTTHTGGPYREAGGSWEPAETKRPKQRPFVPEQMVLVQLLKDGPKNIRDSPWFLATYVCFSRAAGFNFIHLKVGDRKSEPYDLSTTIVLHPDGSPSTESNESEQRNGS